MLEIMKGKCPPDPASAKNTGGTAVREKLLILAVVGAENTGGATSTTAKQSHLLKDQCLK